MMRMLSLMLSSPGLPPSSRKGLSAGPVLLSFRILPSAPRMMLWLPFATFKGQACNPCDEWRRVLPQLPMLDHVRKAVHSFPSTSGAGRSGLRPSHIRDATRPASSDLLFRLISEVVNLLLQGAVPESIRPFVCGASIMALRKPNGTLRPIAVGETFRRITSKVAVELISDQARTILEPIQLGVKTPNGCEAIIHTTRQRFHRHRSDRSKTAVSVDISNAFNTVHRSAVLQSIRTHFPLLGTMGGLLLSL